MGKMMEKAGNMMHKDNIAEKGREKREQAGGGYGGSSGGRDDY